MKILMVSPYPPLRDGIASYAVQTVARLRAEGHEVEVLSPSPSAAHHHLCLLGPRGALALAKRVRHYDKVIVQFHPEVFFPVPSRQSQWAAESLALFVAFFLARQVEVRLHEIDYTRGQGRAPYRLANRLPWRAVTMVVVHTEVERENFSRAYGVAPERIEVAEHGADFRRSTTFSQADARASLGLPADDFIFLNIGFIQRHKGFDRSVRAMQHIGRDLIGRPSAGRSCRLDIVGSVRTPEPAYLAYLDELTDLVDVTPGVHLRLGYLSDELFDRWLVACDVVVLPYRSIWSSGVLERALLYEREVIATDVGGLSFQRGDRDAVTLVEDDLGLRRAMTDAALRWAGVAAVTAADPPAAWVGALAVTRDEVQSEIRHRAARRRGAREASDAVDGGRGGSTEASAPVRGIAPLVIPAPASKLPGVATVKRLVGRLTTWQTEPLVHQVNALREAMIKSLER
jgi:glycosyltransferase involved in cell wall biosynthesis